MNHEDTKTQREPSGLLINFTVPLIEDRIERIVL